MITLQFSTQTDFVSAVIRYVSKSEFSHVDCVLPNGEGLLGARLQGGVLIRQPGYAPFTRIAQYTFDGFTPFQEKQFYAFLRTQVGKPYDWPGIVNFALHLPHDWRKGKRWFCSALQDAASEVAGDAFLGGDPDKYSPGDLVRCGKLKLVFDRVAPFTAAASAQ